MSKKGLSMAEEIVQFLMVITAVSLMLAGEQTHANTIYIIAVWLLVYGMRSQD